MKLEVELKFPVAEMGALESRLVKLGAAISSPQLEVDTYFAHPARDFARTDEALRLRRKDNVYFITYKGPKIDAATKTRREIDLPLTTDEGGFRSWFVLLDALGFKPVGEVRKSRRKSHVLWQDRNVEVSLDEVERLGTFVELELIVEVEIGMEAMSALDSAKACILSLAEELGLSGSERRSYLELLRGR
jgi:adenylate cyclase class 2